MNFKCSKMDINIEEQSSFLDVSSQNDRKVYAEKVETITSDSNCAIDIKIEMEDHALDSKLSSQNETSTKDLENKVTDEIVTCGNFCHVDIKTEIEEDWDSNFCLPDQREFFSEHPVLEFNHSSNSETEPRISLKTEQWWLNESSTETSSIYGGIKDTETEDPSTIKSASLYNVGISSYTSDLFTNEDSGNGTSFNIRKDRSDCESAINRQSQENHITNKQDSNKTNSGSRERRRVFGCELCQKTFKSRTDLKCHRMMHENKEAIKCDVCGKNFGHFKHLKRHKIIHEGIKPYKCQVCDKAFTDLSSLKRHTMIHEGLKPYKCEICDRAFTQLSTLKTHKYVHEGLKPHKCDVCDKAFTQLQHLNTHKLIHGGIRPHKCDICDKTFTRSEHLKRHTLIHEGIKSHQCDVCNKSFTRLEDLKTHKFIHEDIKPHKCDVCDKAFPSLSKLKRHKSIHQDKKPC